MYTMKVRAQTTVGLCKRVSDCIAIVVHQNMPM